MTRKKTGKDLLLDEILEDDKNYISQYERENFVLEPLLEEIDAIRDEGIRNFTRSVLLKATVFWEIPSVFAEVYNPPDEHGNGGNVIHTKRVFRICAILAETHLLDQIERDMLFSAALLHDVTKGVLIDSTPAFDEFHPYTVDKFVRQVKLDDDIRGAENESTMLYIQEDHASKILRMIRCHMGIWSPIPETYPVNDMEMILYTADAIASKLHWVIDGDEIIMERWVY